MENPGGALFVQTGNLIVLIIVAIADGAFEKWTTSVLGMFFWIVTATYLDTI